MKWQNPSTNVALRSRHFKVEPRLNSNHSRAAVPPSRNEASLSGDLTREGMLFEGLDPTSVAFALEYESARQFNREYKRCFGQARFHDIKAHRFSGFAMLDQEP